ncbi:hypothetical protein Trydic_g14018 [Trypoxylus dichotomus]
MSGLMMSYVVKQEHHSDQMFRASIESAECCKSCPDSFNIGQRKMGAPSGLNTVNIYNEFIEMRHNM